MISRLIVCLTFFFTASAFAGSVTLVNDTAFKLRAVIRAADSTYLGEVVVNPQATMQWNDYTGGVGTVTRSRTPYVVAWFCMDGGNYSVCDSAATGGTISANSCDGPKYCKPPKSWTKPPPGGPPTEEHLQQQNQEEAGPPEGYQE